MRLTLALTFLFISVVRFVYCQDVNTNNEQDSITKKLQLYLKKGEDYNNKGNYDSAIFFAEKVLYATKSGEYVCLRGKAISNIGLYLLGLEQYRNSLEKFKEALAIFEDCNDTLEIANCLGFIGSSYDYIGNNEKSIEYQLRALKAYESVNHSRGIAKTYNNIGIVYARINDNDNAILYFVKAKKAFEIVKDTFALATIINNLGAIFEFQGYFEKAHEEYQEALTLFEKINSNSGMGLALGNIAEAKKELRQYDEAIVYYNRGGEFYESIGAKNGSADIANGLAETYMFLKQYDKAKIHLDKALEYGTVLESKHILGECYELYSKFYENQNDYKNAIKYYKLYNQIRDSLINIEKSQKIVELQSRYENEKKEQEIASLKKDNKIQSLELERQRVFRDFAIIATILILLIIFVITNRYYFKLKANKLLKKKNRQLEITNKKLIESEAQLKDMNKSKDKFFAIIAHDIKNPFHAILSTSEGLILNLKSLSKNEIGDYANLIHSSAKSLYQLLENLLNWSRSQRGTIHFEPAINDLYDVSRGTISIFRSDCEKKNIELISQIMPGTNAWFDMDMITITLRNLVNNALKFSFEGEKIVITAENKGDSIYVSVEDNGIGMTQEEINTIKLKDSYLSRLGTSNEKGSGLGLLICMEFIEKHGSELIIESYPQKGSKFSFLLAKMPRFM